MTPDGKLLHRQNMYRLLIIVLVIVGYTAATVRDNPIDACNASDVNIKNNTVVITTLTDKANATAIPITTEKQSSDWNVLTNLPIVSDENESTILSTTEMTATVEHVTTGESYSIPTIIKCRVNLNLSEGNALLIKSLYSFDNRIYSVVFFERQDNPTNPCFKKYVSLHLDETACLVFVTESTLNIVNAHVQLELKSANSSFQRCPENNQYDSMLEKSNNSRCNTIEYDEVKESIDKMPIYGGMDRYASRYVSSKGFDLSCPLECTCILEYRYWISTCNMTGTTVKSVSLLIYTPTIDKLSFYLTFLNGISPGAFSGLDRVVDLDLSDNKFSSIRAGSLHGLIQLQALILSYNYYPLTLYSGAFNGLFLLKILILTFNQITSLPSGIFRDLAQLTILDLSDNYLITLDGVLDVPKLIHLCIYNNQIEFLPKLSLVHLQLLDIHGNRVVTLKATAFRGISAQLTTLLMGNNELISLPERIFDGFYGLEKLFIEINQLTFLPVGIFRDLEGLKKLVLLYNRLGSLPVGVFDGLSQLTYLDLGYNLFTALPLNVFGTGFVNLNLINLGYNYLVLLPQMPFPNMHSLYKCDLSYNELVRLPNNSFDTFDNVFELHLQHNNLFTLPVGLFDYMALLEFLDMSFNNLTVMPLSILQYLVELRFINIANNNLNHLSRMSTLVKLQILQLSNNNLSNLESEVFGSMPDLVSLSLDNNVIIDLPIDIFSGLPKIKVINIQNNSINNIKPGLFSNQSNLKTLNVATNQLSSIMAGSFFGLTNLQTLDMQTNKLRRLPRQIFYGLEHLQYVNLSQNEIEDIGNRIFASTNIENLDLRMNDHLGYVKKESFIGTSNATILVLQSATCCFVENSQLCFAQNPRPVYLTCKRMLDSVLLQVSLWSLGSFALVCNGIVFYLRWTDKQTVQTILITHLSMSDFLMGVNMMLLAVADVYYGDYFPSYSEEWRQGYICQLASILSVLSSEISVLLITLISLDRYQGVTRPLSIHRLRPYSVKIVVSIIWIIGIIMSVTPVLLSNWIPDIFEVSEVCVGIPIVKRPVSVSNTYLVEIKANVAEINPKPVIDFERMLIKTAYDVSFVEVLSMAVYEKTLIIGHTLATYFSIIIFIGLNLFCFLFIAGLYLHIFKKAKQTAKQAGRKQSDIEEMRMAIKMAVLVFTDFCTWVPLIIISIFVQADVIQVNAVVYAWTVAFIIPINSAINPFLYTLITFIENRKAPKLSINAKHPYTTKS